MVKAGLNLVVASSCGIPFCLPIILSLPIFTTLLPRFSSLTVKIVVILLTPLLLPGNLISNDWHHPVYSA